MSRRFYLKTTAKDASAPTRPSQPIWYTLILVIVGAILGLAAWRVTCVTPKSSSSTAQDMTRPAGPFRAPVQPNPPGAAGTDQGQKESSSGGRSVSFEGIRVQVLNGCGVKNLAKFITPGLRARGFDVRETRNAGHFHYQRSLIIDRTGDIGLARVIADSLRIDSKSVTSEISPNLVDIDLTLIVGADYRRLNLNLKGLAQE